MADTKTEEQLFAEAMQGVTPLDRSGPERLRTKPATQPKLQTFQDEEDEVLKELQAMVDGRAPLDFSFSDEFVDGKAVDCSHLDLMRLKNAEFAVQAQIDLHGLNREEARAELNAFFKNAVLRAHRCVLVICGRGHGSPGGKSVLKDLLVRWLAQGQLSYNVLAFCSAKAHDGGVGALYVLLRKNPRRPTF